ncbi:hypothetical protein O2K51_01800 [Apibacter raozihei]|uniref:hypothetical protein n=1 Tax=Apibacter raozihei TaxID=2500547 RepID=UPI000FE2A44F|nr:hypothetical protein [Apibacter raozihei]
MSKEIDIDNLKKFWKEQPASDNHYSKEQLLQMINKKSGNNMKSIIIISSIEFILLMISLIFTCIDNTYLIGSLDMEAKEIYSRNLQISRQLLLFDILISLLFIYFFVKTYRQINILNSVKELINSILRFRRYVTGFIVINIILGMFTLFLTGFYDFVYSLKRTFGVIQNDNIGTQTIHSPVNSPEYTFWFIIICIIIFIIMFIYYAVIYGIFLRKLKNNLKELREIE